MDVQEFIDKVLREQLEIKGNVLGEFTWQREEDEDRWIDGVQKIDFDFVCLDANTFAIYNNMLLGFQWRIYILEEYGQILEMFDGLNEGF